MNHLKVRCVLEPDRKMATLTILENNFKTQFGSKGSKHRWSYYYPRFLTDSGVRMYSTAYARTNVQSYVDNLWREHESGKIKSNLLFKVGSVGVSTRIPAEHWPRIKQAIEEYNRWGERYTK